MGQTGDVGDDVEPGVDGDADLGAHPGARTELQRLHVGTFTGPAGLFRQTSQPNSEVRRLHTALGIALPRGSCTSTPSRRNVLTRHNTRD